MALVPRQDRHSHQQVDRYENVTVQGSARVVLGDVPGSSNVFLGNVTNITHVDDVSDELQQDARKGKLH